MLALASSSLVTQLLLSSLWLASQSALAAFIPRNRFCSQLLRCIHSADFSGLASACCCRWCSELRGTASSFLLHVEASSRSRSSAALRAAGYSELRRLGVCFTSGDKGHLSLQGSVDLCRPESWRFHQWAALGRRGINGGNFWVQSSISFGEAEKMTSVASRAGGRHLRERKETSFSMSTEAIGRKKTKGVVQETAAPDDEMELRQGMEESALPEEFEARLWDLDKSNKLATLTVLELRGYMKLMSKPTAGRKDELISTVKEWLANRGSSTLAKTRQAQAVQETSSDAESLEGALLKAENKNREVETEAMSRGTDISAKRENRKRKDGAVPEKKAVQQEGGTSAAPKRTGGDTPTSTKGKLSKNSQELNGTGDEKPAAKAVAKKKNQSSSVKESNGAGSVVLKESQGRKRKLEQVAKIVQEGTTLQTVEENVVEIAIDPKKPWLTLVHKKPSPDWVVYDPDTMRPPPLPSSVKHMKLLSWNVNGWRALMKDKKAQECLTFQQLAKDENFDVICLQETKLQEKDVEQISTSLPPVYSHNFWNCSTGKLGYAGTAIISRVKPLSVKYGMDIPDHDKEGRLITAEFDKFYLVTGYVPNSGDKLVRLEYRTTNWDPSLSQYLKELEKNKPVIYTGDLNCANEEIDINNPAGNRRSAGFTDEERESFKTNFVNNGFVDTFRQQHPNVLGYTYWGYRTGARPKNNGWRLDYFLVSEGLMNQVHDSYIRPDVLGSDHCPIGLIVKV